MLFAIRHALRGISRRKLKNFINTLGIIIGVSLLAGVQIATDSLVNAMQETVSQRYGNADIVIQKGEFQSVFFNYSIYENLKNDPLLTPYIDGIAPRITSQVSITSFTTTKQTEPIVTVVGINEELDKVFGTLIPDEDIENNDFNFTNLEPNQCIIGRRLANSVIDFDIEETALGEQKELPLVNPIEMFYLNTQGNFTFKSLFVKGVATTSGKGVLNSGTAVYLKLDALQEIFGTNSSQINTIVVSTTLGNENVRNVTSLIENRLQFYLGEEESAKFQVDAQKLDAFEDVEDSIKSFRIILLVFGSLIIISGILLILNITLMNIDERQRSIGIMRALGMTQRQLITVLLTESILLGGIGALLGLGGGVLNGLGIIALLENFLDIGRVLTNIPLIVKPIGLIISFSIGLIIALLAAVYPAWRASRIDIVETINEVETPQQNQRSGNWSIILGGVFMLAGSIALSLSLLINPDWRWMMFAGSIFGLLFGTGFLLSRIITARIAFNGFALTWMAAGLLIVLALNPFLNDLGVAEDMALYTFLIGMLGLVFGTIIFVALNLEWISNRFNELFQKFRAMRSIGIISMRYIGKKKTRSALTFAIFGVILTMNVFLAVFTGSFTLGFDDFAENEEGGVEIIAYSPFPTNNITVEDPIETIKSADENIDEVVGIKFRFSLAGALSYIKFTAENETNIVEEEVPIPTDMWGINEEFLNLTEYKFTEVWEELEDDPWIEAQDASKRYVILPSLITEYGFDEAGTVYYVNLTVGDKIKIPEYTPIIVNGSVVGVTEVIANYTIIAFVETTSYSMLFSSFLFTSENSQIFFGITDYTAFLISTDDRLNTEQNIEISRKIESKLFGYDTICLRDRIEQLLEFINQAINFMQAFVSLGLVVGVLGLIVVSLRGITERTREIGMMRALGFQRSEVITAVVVEIFAVAFVGLIIGFINGFVLGYGMYTQYLVQYDFNFIIPWAALGIFIAITIFLSIVAAIIPARRASRIPPSHALRYTG